MLENLETKLNETNSKMEGLETKLNYTRIELDVTRVQLNNTRIELKMPRRKKEDELPPDQKGPPRGAANARERTRMRVLSKAFGRLKLTLPWVPPDTKLSKLDTLRLATSYISHLQVLLESEEDDIETSDNDNEKDVKIDSSVRTRQLTSLVSKYQR